MLTHKKITHWSFYSPEFQRIFYTETLPQSFQKLLPSTILLCTTSLHTALPARLRAITQGGGRFKDSKPTGAVGEAWVAERTR